MVRIQVPLRPYFQRVESRYGDDAATWKEALAVIAMELARQPAPEGRSSLCRHDGTSGDISHSL